MWKMMVKNLILFFPGTAKKFKLWEDSKWEELKKILIKDEHEVEIITEDKGLTYKEIAKKIKICKTFITVDSFAGHLGNAVSKRGIVLFGGTDPKIFGHKNNINICSGVYQDKQWLSNEELKNDLMKKITVDEVYNAIKKI